MLKINQDFLDKIKKVNLSFRQKYKSTNIDKYSIRQKMSESDVDIRQIPTFDNESLSIWLGGGLLGAVDGSVNQTKGEPPHLIYFFQALAKTTTGYECFVSDVYFPLLDDERTEEEEREDSKKKRSHLLAKQELTAAYQLIEEQNLKVLMMDGALYHYRIDAPLEWEKLKEKALAERVFLVGVSEEITTSNLVRLEAFQSLKQSGYTYDRDLLFGVLHQGEAIYIEEIQHKAGLQSVWMRLGADPQITGFDMLDEQAEHKWEMSRLLATLTPKNGRGIPFWLDHIDREVRVTDKLVEALVEQYIDPELKQRFLSKKREGRPY
ncbi:hypothetical protein AJ85_20050 [Alkalihalobacillus alcalophilus ATCC 27647 = CGMCC 1.3604]|uniref:NurA domain-containing protein n=1 Tax=Alkalihalobacillus alcalophilus ATCC 27647 = CGMCC 1.3604 TaxID=1218173 RepID=A0A094WFB9_ALKAL|nr:DNA double-strand break repair nuclease NurA [Alkalihalobacillus alcalophilus]KGA96459.1 hypothetical protein BALCAV_0216075 [Alkalihalobacillus alcalophilus ATCC 27647 = CGMCC 1.3604]MED1560572.1 DNA double-strand break repair nuclease NurA [Alkalihalobacillus alcalophilus]THG89020.1 hypothetical protein AJ85_20050 [Alkalihalobacillus alcalophilus ATCC 27647 = CGMCC 1.3604]